MPKNNNNNNVLSYDDKFRVLIWLASILLLLFGIKTSVPGAILGIILFILVQMLRSTGLKCIMFISGISVYILAINSKWLTELAKVHDGLFGIISINENGCTPIFQFFKNANFEQIEYYFICPFLIITFYVAAVLIASIALTKRKSAIERLQDDRITHEDANTINWKEYNQIQYSDIQAVPLGVNLWEKKGKSPIGIPFDLLKKHVSIIGTTGSGKTVTIYHFIKSAISWKKPVIFIDGKGDTDNILKFVEVCSQNNIVYHVITMDGSKAYNPLFGTPTELADKLISIFDWSEEHYRLGATRFLQLLIRYMQTVNLPLTIPAIIKYSDIKTLVNYDISRTMQNITVKQEQEQPQEQAAADDDIFADIKPATPPEPVKSVPETDAAGELVAAIKSVDPHSISGFRDRLATLAEGDLAGLFTEAKDALILSKAIEQGEAVLFSVDSLRYPQQAKALGRLVIGDIKTCVSAHAKAGSSPVCLVFDEFNVFASHEVIDIINKSRSAGFEAVIAFQSLSDIDKLPQGESLRRQILENCNSLIVQLQNDSHDAEELSSIFGTYQTTALTVQEDILGKSDMGSRRNVREFIVHPDDIKRLKVGQAFVKAGSLGITKVQIARN